MYFMRIKILLLILFVLILFVLILKPFKIYAQVSVQDSLALVDLYDSTGGPNWINHTNWLTTAPVITWYGVSTSGGLILVLKANNLVGTIPYSLWNLSDLGVLELPNNHLVGTIPASLGNPNSSLFNLDLHGNQLTGSIPTFNGFNIISSLDLSKNQLSGFIPPSINERHFAELAFLNLDSNQLSGTIPDSLGMESSLVYLNLSQNRFNGAVPTTLIGHDSLANGNFLLDSNELTFAGMEQLSQYYDETPGFPNTFTYSPQASIPINIHGDTLSVSAGGTLSNDTYVWYFGNTLLTTRTGDSTFIASSSGKYSVEVTNAIATQLTLYSDTLNVDSIDVPLCPGEADTILSNITGTSYQWQRNTGTGFVNLDGQTSFGLEFENPPSSWYSYQYRCIVGSDTGDISTLKFVDTWTGIANSAWENPANWSCHELPDANTDVYINSGTPPAVLSSNQTIRSLTVSTGASFAITPGYNLTITH